MTSSRNAAAGFFRLSRDPMLRLSSDGVILEANPAWENSFGQSPASIRDEELATLLQPASRLIFTQSLKIASLTQDPQLDLVLDLTAADGSIRSFSFRAALDHDTREFHAVLSPADESEFQQREHQLHAVAEASPDMIGIAAADGTVTYLNRAFRERCALQVGDNLRHAREFLYPPWAKARLDETGLPTAFRDGIWAAENAVYDKQGREIPVSQLLLAVHNEKGEFQYHATVLRDISGIKESERILREHQARIGAQSRLASLGEMAGGIAHEINNPLGIILASAERLQDHLASGKLTAELVQKSAEKIVATAQRISKIVTGLRSLSRDDSASGFERVSVQAIVSETLGLCAEKLRGEQIKLLVDMPPEPIEIECRSVQICQVLLNLIVNAQHAIEALPAKWIQVSARDHGEEIELRVTDSGSGVPASIREKIFNPFFTTKEVGKGTGLGLSISLGLIKAHDGKLSIDASSPTTSFVIRLPKKPAAKASESLRNAA